MTLSDALSRAAETEGVTHMSLGGDNSIWGARRAKMLNGAAYDELIGKRSSAFDMTMVFDVKTGEQTDLFRLTHPELAAHL